MSKLKVYFYPNQNNGCGKYRMWGPADALHRSGLAEVRRSPKQPPNITVQKAMDIFNWADVVYVQTCANLWFAAFLVACRNRSGKKLIVDLDDNLWDIHPMNVGSVDGQAFILNDHFSDDPRKFWNIHEVTDEQYEAWMSGMTNEDREAGLTKPTFADGTLQDFEGKHYFVQQTRQDARSCANFILAHADAVTTTNPFLANVIRGQTGQQNIYQLPNCLDLREWQPIPPRHRDEVWIGWSGSVSHYPDLKPILPALDRLMNRHPNLRIHIMGSCFDYLFPPNEGAVNYGVGGYGGDNQAILVDYKDCGERWPGRMLFTKPSPIYRYARWMHRNWQSDIGIAPLDDNGFNAAKSELKWCEYSLLGIPTVASKFGPYKRAIRHLTDGLLAGTPRSWENALEELISDPNLRHRLAAGARERVMQDYNSDRQVHQWVNLFERVHECESCSLAEA